MPTINISPTVTLDLIAKANDQVSFPFVVLDDSSSPVNFSGMTNAKMTLKDNELLSEVISFSSTGTTYTIDISNRTLGALTVNCNSLAIPADEYFYDFQVGNTTNKITVMQGKFIVMSDITN